MLHVLLVEDSPADALMVREAVSVSPVTADLLVADDGEQAFQLINDLHFEPDIIFMDLGVPRLNAFEFLQQVRANQDTPVVVLSGSADPAHAKRAIELGAKEYIVKPIEIDEFLVSVTGAIARWSSRALARGI